MALTLEEPSGGFSSPTSRARSQFADDQTPPVSTHTLDPAAPGGENGWYTEAVEVTLGSADEAGGSGIREIQYRLATALAQDYDAADQIDQEGDFASSTARSTRRATPRASSRSTSRSTGRPGDHAQTSTSTAGGEAGGTTGRSPSASPRATATAPASTRPRSTSAAATGSRTPAPITWQRRRTRGYRSRDEAGNDETEPRAVVGGRRDGADETARYVGLAGGAACTARRDGHADGDRRRIRRRRHRVPAQRRPWQAYTAPFTVSALGGHLVEYRRL